MMPYSECAFARHTGILEDTAAIIPWMRIFSHACQSAAASPRFRILDDSMLSCLFGIYYHSRDFTFSFLLRLQIRHGMRRKPAFWRYSNLVDF